jgi:hypothetical protein
MRLFILALLGISGFAFAPSVTFGGWVGETMCACPGLAKPLGNNATCEDACYGTRSSPGGGHATPSYDYGAAQRAREAEAERQRQAEADRIERERLAKEKREKDAKFIRDRDAAVKTLKGSSSPAMNQLKGLSATDNFGLKGSGSDAGSTGLKGLRGSDPAPHTDTSVVDARNVQTGLPKSIEDSIPHTPAGDRVRKGFQAISEHDWKVALAWFQDALNHEPGSPGIRRLVDLAQYTLQRQRDLVEKPTVAAMTVTKVKTDKAIKTEVNEELDRSLKEYYKKYPPKFLKSGKDIQSDTEWMNEKEPAWKKFFRLFTPAFRVRNDGAVITIGIRG